MTFLNLKQLLALSTCAALTAAPPAANTSIGSIMAKSAIRIDDGSVRGTAALFPGNLVETAAGSSEMRLRNGGAILMDAKSRVRVFGDSAEIESGKAQFRGGVAAQSGNVRVETSDSSEAIVERSAKSLVVGSLRGSVRVTDRKGVLLASLNPGNAVAFAPSPNPTGDNDQDQGGASPNPDTNPNPSQNPTPKPWFTRSVVYVMIGGALVPVTVLAVTTGNNPSASR